MRGLFSLSRLGPIGASVGLHVVLLGFLVFSFSFGSGPVGPPPPQVIEAVVVDEDLVAREMQKLEEQEKADEEAARRSREDAAKARREAQEEAERLQALKDQRERAEKDRKARAAEERQRQVRLERERKAAEDKARRERDAREKAEQERLAELERQRKAEEQRLARVREEQRKVEEARKAEEQKRKQEADARARAQREEELRLAMAEEERRMEAERAGLMGQYVAVLRQRVQRNWIRPPEVQAGLKCEVIVNQIPGGEVVGVRFGQCNADDVVRRSIEAAVLRASPLPPPPDPSLFERTLKFVFRPE
jgi:colicin import membrane protein